MTSKKIVKEYVIQKGYPENLTPVTFPAAWSSFMNTYAVWDFVQGANNTIRRTVSLPSGYYYVVGAADNSASVNINGQYNISLYGFGDGISATNLSQNTRIYHGGGIMSITITAVNFGGAPGGGNPAGVAVTISKEKVTFYNYATGMGEGYDRGYISTKDIISVGDLVWSTRTNLTQTDQGRYTVVMPFKAAITAYAWGAGGGAGATVFGEVSLQALFFSAAGAPGLYNKTSFTVEVGDTLEVFVGKGGTPGTTGWLHYLGGGYIGNGGKGGLSRTNVNGNSVSSFNGGAGGSTGTNSPSGGGGGGGGASGVLKNNTPVLVAGGGGGSGGTGWDNPYQGIYGDVRFASINNNAMGAIIFVRSSNYNLNGRNWAANYFTLAGATTNSINRGHNLAVINASTLTIESYTVYDTWDNPTGSGLEQALNAVGTGKIIVLFNADACSLTTTARNILQTKYGSTRTTTWTRIRRSHAFIGIAGASFTPVESFSDSSAVEVSQPSSVVAVTDYRGENGQVAPNPVYNAGITFWSGLGGGGGGGGGYPGGQGGVARSGARGSGYAGQCGGNFPLNPPSLGQDSTYWKPGFGAGGPASTGVFAGAGQANGPGFDGRVVLEIAPIGLTAVKVGGGWKQISEAYVKVDGSWKQINSLFVKDGSNWKPISGTGAAGDFNLPLSVGNYGLVNKPHST